MADDIIWGYNSTYKIPYSTSYTPSPLEWPYTTTVRVTSAPEGSGPGGSQGSGVFLSQNVVLTAAHVVDNQPASNFIFFGNTGNRITATVDEPIYIGQRGVQAVLSSDDIAVFKTTRTGAGPFASPISLAALPAQFQGANDPLDLASAYTDGYPGPVFTDPQLTIPAPAVSYSANFDLDPGALQQSPPGTWLSYEIATVPGNSGGPVFVNSGQTAVLVGTVTVSNYVPGPDGYTVATGGVLFTPTQVHDLTEYIREADPNGRKSGWWNTQPTNTYVLNDPSENTVITDDRSDDVYIGNLPEKIVGSLGDDHYYGSSDSSTNGTSLRYAPVSSDTQDTMDGLAEIQSAELDVQINGAGYGNMTAAITDTQGGVSNQTISGISKIILPNGNNTINLGDTPLQVASNGPDVPIPPTNDPAPIYIDAGSGNDSFNIDYGEGNPDAKPIALEGDGGNNDFEFKNTDNASFTVVWGGSGNNVFDFDKFTNVIDLQVNGLTAQNLTNLDMTKLKANLSTVFPANSVVILNPTSNDKLEYQNQTMNSPTYQQVSSEYMSTEEYYNPFAVPFNDIMPPAEGETRSSISSSDSFGLVSGNFYYMFPGPSNPSSLMQIAPLLPAQTTYSSFSNSEYSIQTVIEYKGVSENDALDVYGFNPGDFGIAPTGNDPSGGTYSGNIVNYWMLWAGLQPVLSQDSSSGYTVTDLGGSNFAINYKDGDSYTWIDGVLTYTDSSGNSQTLSNAITWQDIDPYANDSSGNPNLGSGMGPANFPSLNPFGPNGQYPIGDFGNPR